MKKITKLTLILTITILSSCGIPQSEVDKLNAEIETLKKEVDDCKNGADKLFGRANLYFDQKDFNKSKSELNTLIEKYPTSTEADKGKELLSKIDSEIEKIAEQKKKEELVKKKAEEKRIANATSKMRKKTDDMNGITWYHDKTSPRYTNQNGFFAYIGKKENSSPWLRLTIQYAADDWLFIEKYIIKVDDVTYTISEEKYGEIETDNGSGGIWEWLDRAVDQNEMEIIKAVANGSNVKIRYVGKQYHKDRTITSTQKQALRNVLDAYEALGGK